jgi:iron complex outermembrane recepter protein
MNRITLLNLITLLLIASHASAQPTPADTLLASRSTAVSDTPYYKSPFEVTITATRQELPLRLNPAATTVVGAPVLRSLPRAVAVDEALRLVPGVRIDNGTSGSRVHLSIRGQGILTERGIRGTKVLLDGLPLNDPTGFAPDFYDVDWATVEKIEVLRGPAAAFYGGGSAGGVINIITENGSDRPISAKTFHTVGSDNFGKSQWQLGGTLHGINYRVSESRMGGDGYREHQRFSGNNFYFKAHASPTSNLSVTPIVALTEYYNDNSEGLNIFQADTHRTMANPDAIPFNEGQNTRRASYGVTAEWKLAARQQLEFTGHYRHTNFYDAGNVSVQHRQIDTPGASLQYDLQHNIRTWLNHVSVGTDIRYQTIAEYKNQNLRDGVAGGTHEGERQSDQTIAQTGLGVFAIDRLEFTPQWSLMLCGRSDDLRNKLTDNFAGDSIRLSGERNFSQATGRVGVSYAPRQEIGAYANWGQGFLPPATEELANNPAHYGGFNADIESATSQGAELGVRGVLMRRLTYDIAVFHMTTDKDFDRYRGVDPRDQETFYRNLGTTRRSGAEAFLSCEPVRTLLMQLAGTFSRFTYTDPELLNGNTLPNSPKTQIAADIEYSPLPHVRVGADLIAQSGWYVDVTNTIFQQGYTTVGARAAWDWQLSSLHGEFSLAGKNIFGEKYIGFTEPDDGGDYRDLRPLADRNSFQPAPLQEVFGGVKLEF